MSKTEPRAGEMALEAQARRLTRFRFALVPGGVPFLGGAETLDTTGTPLGVSVHFIDVSGQHQLQETRPLAAAAPSRCGSPVPH
jgi:hypothetical protein